MISLSTRTMTTEPQNTPKQYHGEVPQFTDPVQLVHDYTFDQHGRLLVDKVTVASGAPPDASVLPIFRTYDSEGRITTMTSWETTGDAPSASPA